MGTKNIFNNQPDIQDLIPPPDETICVNNIGTVIMNTNTLYKIFYETPGREESAEKLKQALEEKYGLRVDYVGD